MAASKDKDGKTPLSERAGGLGKKLAAFAKQPLVGDLLAAGLVAIAARLKGEPAVKKAAAKPAAKKPATKPRRASAKPKAPKAG